MLGLILTVLVLVLIAVWLAPMIPAPGGQLVRVLCWIGVVICVVYLIYSLLSGAGSAVPAFDD